MRTSEVYYEEAEELLAKGDLVHACEKYYKAAEEAVKLLAFEYKLQDVIREAEENGWDSKTLNDAVSELSKRLGMASKPSSRRRREGPGERARRTSALPSLPP